MKKNSKPPDSTQSDSTDSSSTGTVTRLSSQNDISHDWENQLSQKNLAILKSIEEMIDAELKTDHNE